MMRATIKLTSFTARDVAYVRMSVLRV
jgi:hypothetical protein